MKISVITPTIRPEGLKIMQECLARQTLKDFEWLVEVGMTDKSDLNAALNRMIRRARGELLVFYQDFIGIHPDGLKRFWEAHQMIEAFYTAPVNSDWRSQPENQKKKLDFMQWEIDWGACPKKAIVDIGGFDETLDEFWGFDNVNVGLRATIKGYAILCINNPATAEVHPEAPMKKNRNPEYHNRRLDEIRRGSRVNFL